VVAVARVLELVCWRRRERKAWAGDAVFHAIGIVVGGSYCLTNYGIQKEDRRWLI